MKKLITLMIAIAPFFSFGQLSQEENYVHTTSYQVAVQEGSQATVTPTQKTEGVTYFDGLGRAKQSIAVGQGGNQENIVQHYQYDQVGRQAIARLPFASNGTTPEIILDPVVQTHNFYQTPKYENTTYHYAETKFDRSSLDRPIEQAAPGDDFSIPSGHTIKMDYQSNIATDAVMDFDVVFLNDDVSQPKLVYKGVFGAHELYKTEIKDENWTNTAIENEHTTHQFSDKFGRSILSRSYTKSTDNSTGATTYIPVDTYSVYDDYGNLTYTISPKGTDALLANMSYTDFTQTIPVTSLITGIDPFGESGSFTLSVTGDQLTLHIDPFVLNSQKLLETGAVITLAQPLPDTFIGTFGVMGSEVYGGYGYEFSIESGQLVITGGGYVSATSLTGSFTTTLPSLVVDDTIVDKLGYQYKYDTRNRLIARKVSGAGWESIVYDKLNRPVLTQDAKLAENGEWLFVKYDVFNRAVYTGKYTSALDRVALQSILDSQTSYHETTSSVYILGSAAMYHTNDIFPNNDANMEILSMTHYDNYDFVNPSSIVTTPILGQTITTNTKNLTLGSSVRILGTNNWIRSVIYYDEKARPIYTEATNSYLATQDNVSILYDFTGNVLQTNHYHHIRQNEEISPGVFVPSTSVVQTEDSFSYDHQNRLLTQHQVIKGSGGVIVHPSELITKNTYDELGRVTKVSVGNNEVSPLQKIDYAYTIRGWLKTINDPQANLVDDLFAMQINYQDITLKNNGTSKLNTEALYNGNISEIISRTATDDKKRAYGYQYDNLNRLKKARYKAGENLNTDQKFYDLKNIKYDKNGNIKLLKRNAPTATFDGFEEIDVLKYRYYAKSNQLKKVTDDVNDVRGFNDGNVNATGNQKDYFYDVNGNVTEDKNKNITNITYNYLNLPETMTVDGQGTIDFVYDATGVKQLKTVTRPTGTHTTAYAGKFIYTKQIGSLPITSPTYSLEFFSTSQGYVEPNAAGYNYVYQYKDHQGNIRVSYSDSDQDGHIDVENATTGDTDADGVISNEIVQAKNYYPFGLDHNYGLNAPMSIISGTDHKYAYNGKEQMKDLGVNVTEMDWRQYDNALGRFHGIDALAAMSTNQTPYHFANNNPIVFADPTGLRPMEGPTWTNNAHLFSYIGRRNEAHWASNMFQGGGGASSGGGSSSGNNGGIGSEVINSMFENSPDNASTLWTNHGNSWEKYVQYTYNGPGELVTPESYIVKFDYQWNQNNKNSGNVITQRSYDVFQNNTSGSTGSNNFIPDLGINTALTANGLSGGGGFSSLLEKATTANATAIYKYGTHTTSATALTAQNSARMLKFANGAKVGGKILGGLGVGLTLYQYDQGQISGVEVSVDAVMGIVGLVPGWGTAVSIIYFGGKALYEYHSGETLFPKPINN